MKTATDLAVRLTRLSRERFWNVYTEFDWPEELSGDRYCMAPELISAYGTEVWDGLDEAQRIKLSFYEIANLFSLTLQGERPLVAGLSDRLYSKRMTHDETEYLHHFLDEENKHMVMFGLYLDKYVGKVYPEKKMALDQKHEKGEAEIVFFCKALVVEELGDYYNVKMMNDETIEPIVKQLNFVHHRDESRHIAFGRQHLKELCEEWLPKLSDETRERIRTWLVQYLKSSWTDFYNPTMYKDAGLEKPYEVRRALLAHPATAEFRMAASRKLLNVFIGAGLLDAEPEL